ncbi:hypothetical protein D3C80_2174450 [compost metagenome]
MVASSVPDSDLASHSENSLELGPMFLMVRFLSGPDLVGEPGSTRIVGEKSAEIEATSVAENSTR